MKLQVCVDDIRCRMAIAVHVTKLVDALATRPCLKLADHLRVWLLELLSINTEPMTHVA